MASALTMPAPGLKPLDALTNSMFAAKTPGAGKEAKARAAAQDFEAVFLNSMFQHMFTGIDGDGPFGGNGATRCLAFAAYGRIREIIRQVRRHRNCRPGVSHADRPAGGTTMSAPELQNAIVNASAAEKAIAGLESIMDRLEQALTEETARVRAGKLRDAGALSEAKIEFARLYAIESARIRAAKETIVRWIPDAFDRLNKRHNTFRDLLQTNLTVLATAHAVSEGHHSGRFRRACAQASAVNLWRQRPGAGANHKGNPASRA